MNTSAKYVQVNVGSDKTREDGTGFVSVGFWSAASKALEDSVRGDFPTIETHSGKGTWKGVEEDSVHISTVADVDTYALRVKLADLKKEFGQDAIALIVGSDLI